MNLNNVLGYNMIRFNSGNNSLDFLDERNEGCSYLF